MKAIWGALGEEQKRRYELKKGRRQIKKKRGKSLGARKKWLRMD